MQRVEVELWNTIQPESACLLLLLFVCFFASSEIKARAFSSGFSYTAVSFIYIGTPKCKIRYLDNFKNRVFDFCILLTYSF